ncbi:MAG: hypothetical protein AAF862_07550 [Pseudomonadota bacterium]
MKTNNRVFIEGSTLVDLGSASGLIVWGFRACVQGKSHCKCIQSGFDRTLGADGKRVLECLRCVAECIGKCGRRKIGLATPGHAHFTRDEASMLAALSAAQTGRNPARDAHLTWLLASAVPETLQRAIDEISDGFTRHDLTIAAPAYVGRQIVLGEDDGPHKLRLVASA